jgi:D-glycero-D-manno-heptose 1,7-bisphosphate phosphatase
MGIDGLRPAVFLDRDGVINDAIVREGKPYPPASLAELTIPAGVADALRRLKAAGYLLIVATNQPDVARGKQTRAAVEALHAVLAAQLPIDDFRVCYHDDRDRCECRKPAPGLLLDAARDHRLALNLSIMIGDRWRDVEAGKRAGCATVFIDYGYHERQPAAPDAVVASVPEAVDWILSRRRDDETSQ